MNKDSSTQPASSLELPALTSLRAIAALLVFLYHFPPESDGFLRLVAREGRVGVTVFFVLSGFLISVRYYDRFARGQVRLSEYFVKRAARILPLYYLVLALTYYLATGRVPVSTDTLPEWTLTHALFGAGIDMLAVPSSWSLTVEECFYAAAPLVFLSILGLRRRLGLRVGATAGLLAWVVGFFLAGSAILQFGPSLHAAGFGFLDDPGPLRSFTVFGRFADFALGCGCGLLYLSGRVEALWRRREGALLATLLGAGSVALMLLAETGMSQAHQPMGADPLAVWRWNLVAVLASAAMVLALTCRHAPLSRLLALRLPVYLGRISYALYLIQLTPLGTALIYRLFPGPSTSLILLYAGLNVVSALLFELVEEPAREAILWLWRRRHATAALRPRVAVRPMLRAASLAAVVFGLALHQTTWVLETLEDRLGPQAEQDVLRVLGAGSPAVMAVSLAERAATERRVRLPAQWRTGRPGEERPPASLLVFVNGTPIPFRGTHGGDLPSDETLAYYRRPHAEYLTLRVAAPATVVVVHNRPRIVLALAAARLADAPWALILLGVLGGFTLLAAWSAQQWWPAWQPRAILVFGAGLAALWLLFAVQERSWAPAAIVLELSLLLAPSLWLLARRHPPTPASA